MQRPLAWIVCAVVLVLGLLLWLRPRTPAPEEPAHDSAVIGVLTADAQPALAKQDAVALQAEPDGPREVERDVAATPAPVAVPVDPSTPGVLTVVVVATETGEPLAKVNVSVRDLATMRAKPSGPQPATKIETAEHGKLGQSVFTTPSGRVAFEVPPGVRLDANVWSMNQSASGDKTAVPPLAPGERREVRFELLTRDDSVFCGLALDRETRAPIANAAITGGLAGKPPGEVARTDAEGRFRVTFASWKFFELEIAAPGYALQSFWPDASAPTPETPFVIEIERSASLVVTLRGYAPAEGARLVLVVAAPRYALAHELQGKRGKSYSTSDRTWTAEFDATLRAELEDLPCHVEFTLVARDGERELHRPLETLELAPRERREVVWEFDAGCKLTVKALDADGRPPANLRLWLLDDEGGAAYLSSTDAPDHARRGTTDTNGVAVFESVAPRVWRVGPAPRVGGSNDAFAPVAHVFTIAPGVREQTVELRLEHALYIRGVVLDPQGKPRKASVSTNGEHGVLQGSIGTQPDGTFVVGPLAAGPHQLRAHGSGDVRDSDEVDVAAGTLDVELRLKRALQFLGRVVFAASDDGCAAQVFCTQLDRPNAKPQRADSAPDGSFEFGGLEPGIYGLSAISQDGRAGVLAGIELAFEREPPDVRVQVAPGAQLRVRFDATESSLGVTATCDGVRVAHDSVRAGGSALLRVPAGAVRLSIARGKVNPWRVEELTLAEGEERELVLH